MSQPVDQAYTNTVPTHTSSSHSNGSFGPAFIVLAIILVISVIACVVGRLCNKRHLNSNPREPHPHDHHGMRSKEKEGPSSRQINHHDHVPPKEEADIEFGFGKTTSSSRVGPSEGFKGFKPTTREALKGFTPPQNGEIKSHVRFANDQIQFKPVSRHH